MAATRIAGAGMTDLPDLYVEPHYDTILAVANQKARDLLNAGFNEPPEWDTVSGSGFLTSPEYLAIELSGEGEACVAAMLGTAHGAGLFAAFMCTDCDKMHIVDDKQAERLWMKAAEGAEGVLPAPKSVQ
jgi:hypothetical protein